MAGYSCSGDPPQCCRPSSRSSTILCRIKLDEGVPPPASGTKNSHSAHPTSLHHWHRYEKAVDAAKLNPPYTHGELLLDLYLCCQCSMYCLVSDVIPGVIPAALVDEFTRDKLSHPALDKTPRATVIAGWETILTIIDNRLWRDEKRSLPVGRARFRNKVGWSDVVRRVFETIGFPLEDLQQGENSTELALSPPPIDPSTPEGRASRTTLLRAWVEISAWLAIYQKSKEQLGDYRTMELHVKAESERDMYQTGIGAHVSQISRGQLPAALQGYAPLEESWKVLGMTPEHSQNSSRLRTWRNAAATLRTRWSTSRICGRSSTR
ncbi:hypothetical protein NUW54_g14241 [Trametes sanguinea]|uniref:Uncharacterized protein n=1 Tax=Trametes sanguinea TaxID=158606 RepID=A0ACC1MEI5_9APHY|nr:hypothetical protein NUW54_g14241 [Trametes sanguinea]